MIKRSGQEKKAKKCEEELMTKYVKKRQENEGGVRRSLAVSLIPNEHCKGLKPTLATLRLAILTIILVSGRKKDYGYMGDDRICEFGVVC